MKQRKLRGIFSLSICLTIFLLFSVTDCFAQAGKIPPFRITQTGGKVFKSESLPGGKPVILVYFSPDCDHCTKFMTEFLKRYSEFKKATAALITYLPLEEVSRFEKIFNLGNYPGIYVGTEQNSLIVRNYYKIEVMPFVALFNKKGNLVKLYRKEGALDDLSATLRKLR